MDLDERSVDLMLNALRDLLAPHDATRLVGISCIAAGADSLFADAVIEAGGRLIAVLPSQDYRQAKVKPDHAATFDRLVEAADEVVIMPFEAASRQAYVAANAELLRRADRLVAVWDGQPPTGKGGGTADTVLEARQVGVPVGVVWPEGAARRGWLYPGVDLLSRPARPPTPSVAANGRVRGWTCALRMSLSATCGQRPGMYRLRAQPVAGLQRPGLRRRR